MPRVPSRGLRTTATLSDAPSTTPYDRVNPTRTAIKANVNNLNRSETLIFLQNSFSLVLSVLPFANPKSPISAQTSSPGSPLGVGRSVPYITEWYAARRNKSAGRAGEERPVGVRSGRPCYTHSGWGGAFLMPSNNTMRRMQNTCGPTVKTCWGEVGSGTS